MTSTTVTPAPGALGLLVLLHVFLLSLHCARAGIDHDCDFYRPPSPMGQCGRHLADTLSGVCVHFYGRKKRSTDDDLMRPIKSQQNLLENPDIFLPKEKALTVLERGKRGVHGRSRVSCECCWYRCTIREFAQYCSVVNTNFYVKRDALGALAGDHVTAHKPHDQLSEREKQDLEEKQWIGREILSHDPSWMDPFDPHIGGQHADVHVPLRSGSQADRESGRQYLTEDDDTSLVD